MLAEISIAETIISIYGYIMGQIMSIAHICKVVDINAEYILVIAFNRGKDFSILVLFPVHLLYKRMSDAHPDTIMVMFY